MAVEEIGRLRTIAIVGQGGTGKTQAADAMLFTAGATPRLGRPDDGSAAMDFEPEETKHHISISSAFNHLNWKKTEVILADTPGYTAFLPETITTLRAVDGVVMLISPGADTKIESEKIWAATEELKLPRIAFVSRLDRERTSFDAAMKDLEKVLGARAVALTIPIGEELGFKGVVDVLAMKALSYADTSGKFKEEELSAELKARAEAARTALFEAVAETDDALLEKYLDKGTLDDGEVRAALHAAVVARKITPVFCGSGAKNIGIAPLLDAVTTYLPAPNERPPVECRNPATGEPVSRPADPAAPFAALVFKTIIDPFAGKLSIFRIISGHAQTDGAAFNSTRESKERFGQLLRLEGKKQSPIAERDRGRDRRRRQAEGHHHRRHSMRRESAGAGDAAADAPGGRDVFRNSPQDQGRRGEVVGGAAEADRGGSGAGNASRSANPRHHFVGHRPDAYRNHGREAAQEIQRGRRASGAQGSL